MNSKILISDLNKIFYLSFFFFFNFQLFLPVLFLFFIKLIVAGADIVMTNTYQASVDGFQKYFELSACESYNLIANAVHFVRRAIALENVHQPLERKSKRSKILYQSKSQLRKFLKTTKTT